MTSIKIKFRTSSVSTKEGTLFYQVIHEREVRQINTNYRLFPTEWNKRLAQIRLSSFSEPRQVYLSELKDKVEEDTSRLGSIISHLERSTKAYTTDKIVDLFLSSSNNKGFVSFTKNLMRQLKLIGKGRTSETYTTVLNSFIRFHGEEDIPLKDIDSGLITKYEVFLKTKGLSQNSTSFYMRNLRAIYNRAVEKGLTTQQNPFKHVYTGIDKTVKRAISMTNIRQIKDMDLTSFPTMDYARDMFMFSFYTRGMSFVDMAFLKKKNLQNGTLSYRRQKTNQQLFIKWEKPMQDILKKYDTRGTSYLLPIIKDTNKNVRLQYKNAAHLINKKLKQLGEKLEIPAPLTMYVARHSWASIAKSKNIPISVISEGMGHDSENTTRIYLASLDTSVVDKANKLILKSL